METRGGLSNTDLKDGCAIMDIKAHMMYIVYSLIFIILFFLAQLPDEYGVEMDIDLIVQAITYVDADGNRVTVPEWVLGPGKRKVHATRNNADAHKHGYSSWKTTQQEAADNWDAHYNRYASVLPVVQVKGALQTLNNMHELITNSDDFLRNHAGGFQGEKKSGQCLLKCKIHRLYLP